MLCCRCARPGPATAHRHRGLALRSLRHPPHRRRLRCCVVDVPGQVPPPPTGAAAWPSDPSGALHTGGARDCVRCGCLKPVAPLLVSTRVGLKPLRPLQARDVGQLKPASPLRVRNGCFWRIFRPQRCHRFQRLLLRGEQWCRGFQTPNDCRLQRRHGFHMHVACPVGGVALWPRVFRAPDGPAVWPCCLWPRWCFGRRRAWPPARLGVLTLFGAAPRSPPVPSGPSGALHTGGAWSLMCGSARRLVVRPGLATARWHRGRRVT